MPRIIGCHHSRFIPTFKNLPKEMRVQFMRNRVFYIIEPTEEDIEEGVVVGDSFDDINEAVHKHSKGLFTMHTTLVNSDQDPVDFKETFPDEEGYLQVVILFELEEDRKRFMRDYLMLEKLRS